MLEQRSTTGLLGREREQAELYDALKLALKGEPQVVVIGGDAGIGKTTLVSDLVRRAEGLGVAAVVGHCLDIDAGVAFGAVVEAVGELVGDVADPETRPHARRMRILLDPETPRSREPLRVREDLLQTVLEAARAGPVLLVLEDMHWAGRSTQDFAVALSRTLRGRLLFVLTVRRDDLHRRHPARKTLAEITAFPAARRIELDPLGRDAITGIVAARTGGRPDPSLVGSVLARSEGNPLYAEEIVAAGSDEIPEQLADLFLARIDALPEGARQLVRMASVDGTHVDVDTLAELAGLDGPGMDASLRELFDANVLRSMGDSLAFRHGLLREAVYDDLLPDERTRLHAELASILQARVDVDPEPRLDLLSRLAFHSAAAHDPSRALVASERAGMVAWRVGAAESVIHLERALSLWDRVPDAQALVGRTKVELVSSLARAAGDQGDGDRWRALTRRAVEMIEPETESGVASRVFSASAITAIVCQDIPWATEAVRLALEHAGEKPSVERAHALCAQALLDNVRDRIGASLLAADRAVDVARDVADADSLMSALQFKSEALKYLGRMSEAMATSEQAIDVARKAGLPVSAYGATGWLVYQLLESGKVARAVSLARETYQEALVEGVPPYAAWCFEVLVTTLTWDGCLDSAEAHLDELRTLGPPPTLWQVQADLSLARGDADAATRVVPRTAVHQGGPGPFSEDVAVLRELRICAMRDDAEGCVDVAESYLSQLEGCDSPLVAAAAARIGFQALTLAPATPTARAARVSELASRQLGRARHGLTAEWRGSYFGIQLALAEGYAARVAGQPGTEHFREAASLARPFGDYFALEPRLELAMELLAHGSRDEGRELLVDCWTSAHDMGAAGMERRAARLATRARVPLPGSGSSEGALSRLTPREREVLDLLATGATNKGIAETLVISDKTVSVHVSNVLAKLGVENRGAAAALARGLQA